MATKVAMVDKNKKVFALQVASLDSEESVAKQWKKINRKAAPLFRDKITTNVEKAKVNPKLAGWFVGQVMKATGGKANPAAVNKLVSAKLK